jgi:hypothetical protein
VANSLRGAKLPATPLAQVAGHAGRAAAVAPRFAGFWV